MDLNPYLTFDGNAREALDFYAEALGGQIEAVMTFGEMPDSAPMDEAMKNRLAHGRVVLGAKTIMVSDTWSSDQFKPFQGFSIQTSWDTVEEAHAAFARLSEGGQIIMPIEETFWARAFGMCLDKFGVQWMCNCDNPA